jgi:ribosomal protein S7
VEIDDLLLSIVREGFKQISEREFQDALKHFVDAALKVTPFQMV